MRIAALFYSQNTPEIFQYIKNIADSTPKTGHFRYIFLFFYMDFNTDGIRNSKKMKKRCDEIAPFLYVLLLFTPVFIKEHFARSFVQMDIDARTRLL